MKKTAMIRARIEPAIKKEAESVFKEIGLNVSEAIGLFYRQVKLRKGMPFEVNIDNTGLKSEISSFAQAALVEQAKMMSPQERLNAFLNQTFLMKKIQKASFPKQKKIKRTPKHAG